MNAHVLDRITLFVTAAAAPMVILAFVLGGVPMATGALVGAAIAIGNWMSLRWLMRRIAIASDRGKAGLMLVLVAKMTAVLVVTFVAVRYVDATGVLLGLGALVIGVVAGSFAPAAVPADAPSLGDD